jgi:hypothetical protein
MDGVLEGGKGRGRPRVSAVRKGGVINRTVDIRVSSSVNTAESVPPQTPGSPEHTSVSRTLVSMSMTHPKHRTEVIMPHFP